MQIWPADFAALFNDLRDPVEHIVVEDRVLALLRCRSSRLFIRRERLTGELQQDTFVFRLDIFAHTINSIQIIVRFSADCLIYIVTHFARFVKYFQEHFTFQPHFIFIQTTSSSKTHIYTKIPS